MQVVTSPDGLRNFTVCIGTFTDVGSIVDGASDALFGDSFMRNAYSVYVLFLSFESKRNKIDLVGNFRFNFGTGGTTKGTPFVQLLSQTDATKAGADLTTVRTALMANMPPELAPVDIVRIFNGTESASGKGSSSTGSGGKGGSSGSGGSTGSTGAALSVTPSLSLAGAILLLAVISF
jgi:uncharacterized membrane protein YgcG